MALRTGILGGSFDPIHYGHLAIAQDALDALNLDQVLFVPAAQQPFKQGLAAALPHHRMAMVKLACADNARFTVSPIEIERAGVSYTATTLETLRAQSDGELFFLVGADALASLPQWYQAARLPALAKIIGVQRPGVVVDQDTLIARLPALVGRIQIIDGPMLQISSTALRYRVASGRSIRYLTPDAVVTYIQDQKLYQ